LADLELQLRKSAGARVLRLHQEGSRYVLDGQNHTVKEATTKLLLHYGLGQADVTAVLQAAAARVTQRDPVCEFTIKAADGYTDLPYLTHGGPYAPGLPEPPYGSTSAMGQGFNAQFPQDQLLSVPDMRTDPANQQFYQLQGMNPDPQAVNLAQQAASTGQKEVFDTAMIGSLLKATRDDLMVDRHLEPLLKGLDRVGRLLFIFYWNQDKFADRYGQADMPELEDTLRGTFEQLGDLVLFLKQRAIDSDPQASGQAIDLSQFSEN
jgi:hypothetical protein